MGLFPKIYSIGSIIIGALEVVDGLMLMQAGKMSDFSLGFAIFEALWVPVSVVAIILFAMDKRRLFLPISYVAYNVLGWAIGIGLAIYNAVTGQHHDPNGALPLYLTVPSFMFGLYFLIFSGISCKANFSVAAPEVKK